MAETKKAADTQPVKRGRGRPKGSKNKPKPVVYQRNKGRPNKDGRPYFEELLQKWGVDDSVPPIYKCTRCGKLTTNPREKFYLTPQADWQAGNDHYSSLCNECLKKYFEYYRKKYDERTSLMICCCLIGKYFSEILYEQLIAHGEELELGKYFRALNVNTFKERTFIDYLKETASTGRMFMTRTDLNDSVEVSWSKGDKQNKNYVVQVVGYDPFSDDSYNSEDRKFLYNTLATYFTEDVVEDPHKTVSVIGLVQNLWQIEKITQMVNFELKSPTPSESTIKQLIATKNDLQENVNKTARENAISASGSGKKSAVSNSLTAIMKAMINDGFDDIKANVLDAQMTQAYKQIAETNAKALQDELVFTSDDYAKMVAEQSETIKGQSDKLAAQEEEIRLLKIQVEELEGKVRVRGAKKVEIIEPDAEGEIV